MKRVLRCCAAWAFYWPGHVLYRAGHWLLVLSECVQGPQQLGPWDEPA